ncbi:MAG TPA: hypothetical protein V6C97_19375 [Oculatellaceae cyanobacterium]
MSEELLSRARLLVELLEQANNVLTEFKQSRATQTLDRFEELIQRSEIVWAEFVEQCQQCNCPSKGLNNAAILVRFSITILRERKETVIHNPEEEDIPLKARHMYKLGPNVGVHDRIEQELDGLLTTIPSV